MFYLNLEQEILGKIKPDWDIFTQIRYIYIRLCEIFSYNYQYTYDETKRLEIYNEKLNIKNIKKFEIVCSTWCYIAKELMEKIGIDAIISYEGVHVFLIIELFPYKIKLDSMKLGNDLTRVKIGSQTEGFIDLNDNKDFQARKTKSDLKIYKDNYLYTDVIIKNLQQEMLRENMFINEKSSEKFNDQVFFSKIDLISSLLNNTNRITKYGDYIYYLDYLKNNLLTANEKCKLMNHPFWNTDEGFWNILNLICIETQEEKYICYKLARQKESYALSQIDSEELNYYVDNYNGLIKGIYRNLPM